MVDYVPGYLIYQRDGTLVAHPFDEKIGRVSGEAVPLVEDVQFNGANGRGAFAVSPTGVLVYRTGAAVGIASRLTWFDRAGRILGTVGAPAEFNGGRLSPDGRRLVVSQWDNSSSSAQRDLWIFDLDRGVPSRFTADASDERGPVWSPDGTTIVFRSDRKGPFDLCTKAAGGATAQQPLHESPDLKVPTGFSPDGKTLLFTTGAPGRGVSEMWALPMAGDSKPARVFPGSTASEREAVFSPDGRWIAHTSVDAGSSGGSNVYVQSFPPNGTKTRISTTTGSAPAWTKEGREIIYVTDDDHYMAVDVTAREGTLVAGLPKDLFVRRQTSFRARGFIVDPKGEPSCWRCRRNGTKRRRCR